METFSYDPVLYTGHPLDRGNRPDREMACYDLLDRLEIPYVRAEHQAADTIEDCHLVETVLGADICKNLFLTNRQQTEFYLLLMEGDKPFKTKYLSPLLGCSRLSFAGPEAMLRHLNVYPGSVSVLGLMNDAERSVHLVIDRPVVEKAAFGCHPCNNSATVAFSTSDLLNKLLPFLGVEPTVIDLPSEQET